MLTLKMIFGLQICLKQEHFFLLIVVLNIYCVWQIFITPNMLGLNFWQAKKANFTEIVNESKRKRDKLWVDKEREFYNNLMQKCILCKSFNVFDQ